tara:strand:- start:454 stop:639 length:186 start_codon:yes stop_codon:yes gene_type:complete
LNLNNTELKHQRPQGLAGATGVAQPSAGARPEAEEYGLVFEHVEFRRGAERLHLEVVIYYG